MSESYRQKSMARKKTGSVVEAIKTIVYAVLIAIVIRTFAFEPFNIPSGSMIPTLLIGDYLFVSKYSYGYSRYSLPWGLPLISGRIFQSSPQRGDVVVIQSIPGHPHGHMAMYDGEHWVSDFKQRTLYPGDSYRAYKPSYVVYRHQ